MAERTLHGRLRIPTRFYVFDVLAVEAIPTLAQPYHERRAILEDLELGPRWARAVDAYDDGATLFTTVEAIGLEGVVATRLNSLYRPGEHGWIKTKNRRQAPREYQETSSSV